MTRKVLGIGLVCLITVILSRQQWVAVLANIGLAEYQNQLGNDYESGNNEAQSFEEAAEWYKLAAAQGLPEAEYNYGKLFEMGNGLAKDLNASRYWYKKAANQGYEPAIEAMRAKIPRIRTRSKEVNPHEALTLNNDEKALARKICAAWIDFQNSKSIDSSDKDKKAMIISYYDRYYHLQEEFTAKYGSSEGGKVDEAIRLHELCEDLGN